LEFNCAAAVEVLIAKMKAWFSFHNVLDTFGVVYPLYWLQGDYEVSF
jgi:hypothetical protein